MDLATIRQLKVAVVNLTTKEVVKRVTLYFPVLEQISKLREDNPTCIIIVDEPMYSCTFLGSPQ